MTEGENPTHRVRDSYREKGEREVYMPDILWPDVAPDIYLKFWQYDASEFFITFGTFININTMMLRFKSK